MKVNLKHYRENEHTSSTSTTTRLIQWNGSHSFSLYFWHRIPKTHIDISIIQHQRSFYFVTGKPRKVRKPKKKKKKFSIQYVFTVLTLYGRSLFRFFLVFGSFFSIFALDTYSTWPKAFRIASNNTYHPYHHHIESEYFFFRFCFVWVPYKNLTVWIFSMFVCMWNEKQIRTHQSKWGWYSMMATKHTHHTHTHL